MDLIANYSVGKFLVILFFIFQIRYFIILAKKGNRTSIKVANDRLEYLRTKPIKTMEEQREFVNIKYPKSNFKWSWKIIPKFMVSMIIYMTMSLSFFWVLRDININLFTGLLVIMVGPLVMSMILRKFGLNQSGGTTDVLFKAKKRKI